jgi:HK97 family phage major capsid protein
MNLRLSKDSNGQYSSGGPFLGQYGVGGFTNVGMIWGLRAVVTVSIAQGTALVGAFKYGGQIFRRQGLTLETTNTDQDDFIKNLHTIRAEERLALAVFKPAAFCSVTNIPAVQ